MAATSIAPDYRAALPSADLPPGTSKVVRLAEHAIALFRTGDGELVAVDNACPHEGYPLVQGKLAGGVLTCAWHNFKFDARDGRCIKGDEDVRVYATRERDGHIEVDLAQADAAALPPRWRSLRQGTLEVAAGRVARDIARLLKAGVPAHRILAEAVRIDAEHAEWGCTHALALATDLLERIDAASGLDATLPLLHVFALAGEPSQRRPARVVPPPQDPGASIGSLGEALRDAVEREDADLAQALVRGALARGYGRAELEPCLLRLVTDHFLGFGHPHIYLTKVFDLLEAIGFEHADVVLPALVFAIVNATREDTLPPMRATVDHVRGVEAELDAWRAQPHRAPTADERETFYQSMLEGRGTTAVEGLTTWLEAGIDPAAAVDETMRAASTILVDFDEAIHADPTVQDDWLFATHLLTYAHAIGRSLARHDEGHLLKSVYYGVHFVHRSRKLRRPVERRLTIEPMPSATADDVIDAVRRHDERAALGAGLAVLEDPSATIALRRQLETFALADPSARPIVIAHYVKTFRAAFEASAIRGGMVWPVLAALRFAAAPIVETDLQAAAHEAVQLIGRGRLPRRISS